MIPKYNITIFLFKRRNGFQEKKFHATTTKIEEKEKIEKSPIQKKKKTGELSKSLLTFPEIHQQSKEDL